MEINSVWEQPNSKETDKPRLKVRFMWFQPRMNDDRYFINLLNDIYDLEVINDPIAEVDIEFVGVYKPELVQRSELVAKSMLFLRSAFSKSGGGGKNFGERSPRAILAWQ